MNALDRARGGLGDHKGGGEGANPHSAGVQSPRTNKIKFARLATCVLNVERTRKKSIRIRGEDFLHAAETGDVLRLRTLVQTMDINQCDVTDPLGRTAIQLAMINEHKDAVRLLMDYIDKRRAYQALLYAINLGNDEIAEMIIEHPSYAEISEDIRHQGRSFFELNMSNDDNQFSEEITPLILASQQNRFEIVMALLLKNERIDQPHKCYCTCADCLARAHRDELKFARSRLNAYRALSSEAYISLSSEDPILMSFRLRKELQLVAKQEKYYTAEYSVLASKLSEYVVKLLDKVYGNEELNSILNALDGSEEEGKASDELSRLQLAIECNEKKFVAHPSCQKKLTTLWYGDYYSLLRRRSDFVQSAIILVIILIYPALALIYILAPYSLIGRLLKTPCVKFVAHAASYMSFLGLIVIQGQVETRKLCLSRVRDHAILNAHYHTYRLNLSDDLRALDDMCIRNNSVTLTEGCIFIWISGMVWQACKEIHRDGALSYFRNIYNSMDFFMLKFYMASFALRRVTETTVQTSLKYFELETSWLKLIAADREASYFFYWLNADRFYWNAFDPVNVCEALFAVGNILNFARLFHLLAINELLGPMLISLERMIKDVMKFMVTFVPIFLAFMVGMYNLYWYYDPSVRGIVELTNHNIKTRAEEGFGSLEFTFRTIFWVLFGLKDARMVELSDSLVKPCSEPGQQFNGRFTESVGYIVFGVYNWGAVIVLLNMLIAMMTRSFDKIATDQDIEWKFTRSKVYVEYIRQGSTLSVPFNLIPTPKAFMRIFRWVISTCCGGQRKQTKKGNAKFSKDLEETSPICAMNGTSSAHNIDISGSANVLHNSAVSENHDTFITNNETKAPAKPLSSIRSEGKNSKGFKSVSLDLNNQDETTIDDEILSGFKHRWSLFETVPVSFDQPDLPAVKQRTVIKTVVRRFIFERLLASDVPSEGSNELENIKNQTSAVQDELRSMKPKIFEQFGTISKEFFSLQRGMLDIRKLLLEMKVRQQEHDHEEKEADNDVLFPLKDDLPDYSATGSSRRPAKLDIQYSLRGEHPHWELNRRAGLRATHSAPANDRHSDI